MRNLHKEPQIIQIIINPPVEQRPILRGSKAHPRGRAFGIQAGEAFENQRGYRHGKRRGRGPVRQSEGYRHGKPSQFQTCSCGAYRD